MDADHPPAVGVDVAGQQLEPPRDGGQVPGEVAQPGDAGAGDEALRQQAAELLADVLDRVELGARRCGGQRETDVVRGGQHLLDVADDPGAAVDELPGDIDPGLLEGGCRPHRLGHQGVDRSVGAVVEQSGERAVGVAAQHQPGTGADRALDRFDGRGRRQPQQPAQPEPHRRALLDRRGEHPHADRRPGVDERWIAAHDVLAAAPLDDLRQFVDVRGPAGQAVALELAGDGIRHRSPDGRGELLLQGGQVLAARHHLPGRILDDVGHPQVRGQLVGVEGVERHQHAGAPLQLALQADQQRLLTRLQMRQNLAGGVGHRHEGAAQVLGQRADQRGDELLAQRRHLPRELVATEAGEHGDGDVHGDAVVLGPGLEAVGDG